jgi:hypothetical protein
VAPFVAKRRRAVRVALAPVLADISLNGCKPSSCPYSPKCREGVFSEVRIAAVQHPWGTLVETSFLQVLSSLLGTQESDGQHRHPEHGGVDVDALLNPRPGRRFVCGDPASL